MLTNKNKKMIRKMRKYIKTFPLTEKEINQMVEDITGMAEEAQERNEDFEIVLGKPVREFCDDLIYSVEESGHREAGNCLGELQFIFRYWGFGEL